MQSCHEVLWDLPTPNCFSPPKGTQEWRVTLWIPSLHGSLAAPEVGPWALTTFLGHIHKRKETSPISEAPWAALLSQYLFSLKGHGTSILQQFQPCSSLQFLGLAMGSWPRGKVSDKKGATKDWMFVLSENSHVETRTPKVMVIGNEDLGLIISWGWALVWWD